MIDLLFLISLISIILLIFNKKEFLNQYILIINASCWFLLSAIFCLFSLPVAKLFPMLFQIYSVLPTSFVLPDYFFIDTINIYFLTLTALLYLGISIYNYHFITSSDQPIERKNFYSICFIIFVFSMTGLILSTHLTLLWVFIELSTLASTFLIIYDKSKNSLEAGWKYLFICSIGIALAFLGIILLTIGLGHNHSLFFKDLYKMAKSINPFWLKTSYIFILIGIGTKMGLAPVHTWLPDAHSEAPSPISAMLSGGLLNVAFLGIFRVHKLMILAGQKTLTDNLLMLMGFMSLFVCAIYMFKVKNYKRMLAYSSVENMGIIAIGTAIGGIGFYAALLHMLAHSLTKTSLFLTAGNMYQLHHTKIINKVTGLLKNYPLNGYLLLLGFLSISGIPPFPIFITEFYIVKGFLQNNQIFYAVSFVFLITFIIAGMGIKIFQMLFKKSSEDKIKVKLPFSAYITQIVFFALLIILGCYMPDFIHKLIVYSSFSL